MSLPAIHLRVRKEPFTWNEDDFVRSEIIRVPRGTKGRIVTPGMMVDMVNGKGLLVSGAWEVHRSWSPLGCDHTVVEVIKP